MRTIGAGLVAALGLALATAAEAAPVAFPPDSAWAPLPCGNGPMVDARRDQPGFFDDLDIVGVPATPAGLRAVQNNTLFLRLRVDANPAPGGTLAADAWGWEIDTDGDRRTYEVLISVANTGATPNTVAVYRHSGGVDDPADPATSPPVLTLPFADYARTLTADSQIGGNPDYFIDLAVPFDMLATVGITPTTVVSLWAGSSTAADRLNGDLACHDGGSGPPRLSVIGPAPVRLDPGAPQPGGGGGGGGGGGNGGGNGERTLEGGPGCALVGNAAVPAWPFFVVVAAGLLVARVARARVARARARSRHRA